MGWTYTHRGDTPVKDFLADRINCENDHAKWLLLDIAIVKMRTAYMAVEIIRRDYDWLPIPEKGEEASQEDSEVVHRQGS